MRRQDAFGIERPVTAERITPHITPPEGGDLYKPIRLPRPYVGKTVIYDIQDRTVSYSGEEIGRPVPRPLGSRRFSSTNFTDLTSPSQIPTNAFNRLESVPPPRTNRTTTQPLQTTGERTTPPTIPRAALRSTVIQPPQEAHHSSEPPLRNTAPVQLTRPTIFTTNDDVILARTETESFESVTESIRAIHKRALYRNVSLMYQRFAFSLTRFPALVLVLMALWTNWGRGEGLNSSHPTYNITKVTNERNSDISALCTGGFILVCQVLLLHQHYNHYNKAKVMSYLYHIVMLLAFCGAAVALVFASISFGKMKNKTKKENGTIILAGQMDCTIAHAASGGAFHPELCLTWNQRIDYLGVIVGASSLVIILATFTMITGAIGQALMKRKLSEEYQRLSVAKDYTNAAMQY